MENFVPPFPRHYTATAYLLYKNALIMLHHKTLHKWLPPGGHIEWGEDPYQAIQREIKEEIGISHFSLYSPSSLQLDINESRVTIIPAPLYVLNEKIPNHGEHIDLIYFGYAHEAPKNPENHALRLITLHELSTLDTFPNVRLMGRKAFHLLGT